MQDFLLLDWRNVSIFKDPQQMQFINGELSLFGIEEQIDQFLREFNGKTLWYFS